MQRGRSDRTAGIQRKGERMKNGLHKRIALAALLSSLLLAGSSCIYITNDATARYERRESLSAPLEAGSTFSARTHDGSIDVEGIDTTECKVEATIAGHAGTEEQAQELAERVEVKLERAGDRLEVVINRPPTSGNAYTSVSLRAQVPGRTSLILATDDGAVHIAGITGKINAESADGRIHAENVNGTVNLKTSDGEVVCTRAQADQLDLQTNDGRIRLGDITAKSITAHTSDGEISADHVRADSLTLRTSDGSIRCNGVAAQSIESHTGDGSIHIECATEAPGAPTVDATTSDGSITFVAPPGLSAAIEARTNDGSIHTQLPITVQGEVKKSLHGTIGAGEGRIRLRTENGSITIR